MRVELDRVRLRRGGRDVLFVPRLSLPRAARIAIIGRNGSGKTTLLETLALLRPPSEGLVRLDGKDVFSRRSLLERARRDVTLVLQEPYLFAGSARANVELPLRIRGLGRRERQRRVESALELVGARELGDRKAGSISAGERQRVALARAIVAEPRLLLLDEPFAHLDLEGIDRLRLLLREQSLARDSLVVLSSPPGSLPEDAFDLRFDLLEGLVLPSVVSTTPRFNLERTVAR